MGTKILKKRERERERERENRTWTPKTNGRTIVKGIYKGTNEFMYSSNTINLKERWYMENMHWQSSDILKNDKVSVPNPQIRWYIGCISWSKGIF